MTEKGEESVGLSQDGSTSDAQNASPALGCHRTECKTSLPSDLTTPTTPKPPRRGSQFRRESYVIQGLDPPKNAETSLAVLAHEARRMSATADRRAGALIVPRLTDVLALDLQQGARWRRWIRVKIVRTKAFEGIVLCLILLNCVFLALEDPWRGMHPHRLARVPVCNIAADCVGRMSLDSREPLLVTS